MCSSSESPEEFGDYTTSIDDIRIAKAEDFWYTDKKESDIAKYLMRKYFSGNDIFGDKIFKETVNICGRNIIASRLSPIKSYADPVGYLKEVAEIEKKLLAEKKSTKKSRRRSAEPSGEPAVRQVDSPGAQDEEDSDSDSVREVSVDVWNEVRSAIKRAKFDAGPSKKRE